MCYDLQALAQEVACYLGLDLGGIKIKRFADGEIYVQVQVFFCANFVMLHLPIAWACLKFTIPSSEHANDDLSFNAVLSC